MAYATSLAIDQGIHGVKDQGAYARRMGTPRSSLFLALLDQGIEKGYEERFRFAGSGSGAYDKVLMLPNHGIDRLFLVLVQMNGLGGRLLEILGKKFRCVAGDARPPPPSGRQRLSSVASASDW